jgi:RNA polymerase sigma factor (TIGR02999 family)
VTAIATDLTGLLRGWAEGDQSCADRLIALLYRELRQIAARQLSRERSGHTLQPTALVHEAWLKLRAGTPPDWQNRAHFLALASRLMRQILVDHARHQQVRQRQLGQRLTMTGAGRGAVDAPLDLLELDQALDRLARLSAIQSRIVELRYFGGLSIEEAASVLQTSVSTVNRGWRAANTWLQQTLVGST